MIVKQQNFDQLIDNIYQTHYVLQENAKQVVNQNLTIRNWLIGYYIVAFEQHGEGRAKYGANLIGRLASQLKDKGLKGFSVSALKNHRTFYLLYPQISQSAISFLQNEMADSDNPPIGLILCGKKGEALAKYATSGMDNQLFVSKYLVQLPDKKVLESFIRKEIEG